jgi:hypothetical protein
MDKHWALNFALAFWIVVAFICRGLGFIDF